MDESKSTPIDDDVLDEIQSRLDATSDENLEFPKADAVDGPCS
jgi:hypothetical protein